MELKTCFSKTLGGCGKELPARMFHRHKSGHFSSNLCRLCHSKHHLARYHATKGERKEKKIELAIKFLKKHYDVTLIPRQQ